MHAERRPETTNAPSSGGARRRPRVVVFHLAGQARVEVLELPETARLGSVISHGGRCWRVTGFRTRDRVLIAEPDAR